MISLTAIIICKSGSEDHLRQALLEVARYAGDQEAGTTAYFVSVCDKGVFTTYERYADQAALDAHNEGPGAKDFFAAAEGHIESVEVFFGPEIFP